MEIKCKNCNQQFEKYFCNYCGQSSDTHQIDIRFLRHDIEYAILHFEKKMVYTIKQLFIRPGFSINDYIKGKRVKFIKPIRFVFIWATIYGFCINFFKIEPEFESVYENDLGEIVECSLFYEWLNNHYALTTLILIPLYSLITYWVFKEGKYNFLVHNVSNSFIAGQQIIIRLLFTPFFFIIEKENQLLVLVISDVIGTVFEFWAYRQLFDFLSLKQIIKKTILCYVYYTGLLWGFFFLIDKLIILYYQK